MVVTIWRPEKTIDLLQSFLNESSSPRARNFTECVSSLTDYSANDTNTTDLLTYQDCFDRYIPRYNALGDLSLLVKIIWSCFFAVMVSVGTSGNLIVLWIILAHRKMRTVTNYFLMSLCLADLLLAAFNATFNFVFMLNRHWPFGRVYCIISNFVAYLSVASSVLTISSMSIERYLAVVRPLSPRISRRKILLLIGAVWIAGTLLSLPPLLLSTVQTYKYADGGTRTLCILAWPDGFSGISKTDYLYNVVFLLLTFVIPMLTMGVTYTWMGQVLWMGKEIGEVTEQQKEAVRNKQKIVKMLVITVLLFAICWLPYHVYFLYTFHHKAVLKTQYVQHVYLLFYWLAMSHSMYNPIVYYWMNGRFRAYFRSVLCCERVPGKPRVPDSRYYDNGITLDSTLNRRSSRPKDSSYKSAQQVSLSL